MATTVEIFIKAYNQSRGAFQSLGQDFRDRMKDSDNFKLKMSGLDSMLSQGIGVGALYGLGRGFKAALDEAERTQNSLRGLAATARYAGENIGQSMDAATQLTSDGLIDIQSASKSLQNLLSRGFSLQESIDIINRLKDAAAFNRQESLSMTDAVQSATEGLKNENSQLVDNAGVTKNVAQMWKEYAASIGKGADSLTQAEKRTAEYNGIMRETEGQLGNAKLATEGITGAKARLGVEMQKMAVIVGNDLMPAYVSIAKGINWVLENAVKPFIGGVEIMGARLGLWATKAEAVWDAIASGRGIAFGGVQERFKELNAIFDQQATEIAAKWSGMAGLSIPQLGPDTGKRRQDVVLPDTSGAKKAQAQARQIANEWKRIEAELRLDMTNTGLSEFEQKINDIWTKFQEMRSKVGDRPLLHEWLSAMLGTETDRQVAETREKLLEWEDEMSRLYEETEEGITEAQRSEIDKRLSEVDRWKEQLTDRMFELQANGLYSEQEYQDRLTEIDRQSAEKRLAITAQYDAQRIEAQASREIALARMMEGRREITPQESTARQIAATQRLLDAQKTILQDTTLEASARETIVQTVDELSDKLKGLYQDQERFTGTFFDGWAQGFKDLQFNAETAFDRGREASKGMVQTFEQGLSGALRNLRTNAQSWGDFFMDLLDKIASKIEDMIANMLIYGQGGQGSGGGLLGGLMGLLGLGGGGGTAIPTGSLASGGEIGFTGLTQLTANPAFMPAFAGGGIATGPSIFGEAGPEAAVPLPDGRRIPVELRGGAQQAPTLNLHLNIRNESGERIEVSQQDVKVNGYDIVAALVVKKLQTDVGFRNSMASYGRGF